MRSGSGAYELPCATRCHVRRTRREPPPRPAEMADQAPRGITAKRHDRADPAPGGTRGSAGRSHSALAGAGTVSTSHRYHPPSSNRMSTSRGRRHPRRCRTRARLRRAQSRTRVDVGAESDHQDVRVEVALSVVLACTGSRADRCLHEANSQPDKVDNDGTTWSALALLNITSSFEKPKTKLSAWSIGTTSASGPNSATTRWRAPAHRNRLRGSLHLHGEP